MFGLISFGLKIIFASIIGGAMNYIPGKSENSQNIVETSLICILSASVMGLAGQFSIKGEYFVMGFGVLSVIIFIVALTKNFEFTNYYYRLGVTGWSESQIAVLLCLISYLTQKMF